jgi:hypothetical protein
VAESFVKVGQTPDILDYKPGAEKTFWIMVGRVPVN